MKYILIAAILTLSTKLLGQDYEKVARALNHPPLLKLISTYNSLNQNLKIYNDYNIVSRQRECYLELKRGSKKFKIKPDTIDSKKSKNERYGENVRTYYDNQNRLIKTWDRNFVEEYYYDYESRLIEIKAYYDSTTTTAYKWNQPNGWKGKYDEQGNLVEEITTWQDKPDFVTSYKFKGNNIESSELTNYFNKEGVYEKHIYAYVDNILIKVDSFDRKGKKLYTLEYKWVCE